MMTPTISTEPKWFGLGDTMWFFPTIKKLSKTLNRKVDVVTQHPQLFKNNPYVENIFNLEYYDARNQFGNNYFFAPLKGKCPLWFNIDIRQYIAHSCGFDLNDEEKNFEFYPSPIDENIKQLISNKKYVLLTPAKRGVDRDFGQTGWQKLIDILNDNDVFTVLEGAGEYHELNVKLGLNLCGKLNSLSQTWHLINLSDCYVTFDTGMYILAGSTQAQIFLIDSYFDNRWHKPFRNGSYDYKLKVIQGNCAEKCLGNLKYYTTNNGFWQIKPQECPLKYENFKCVPSVEKVAEKVINFYHRKVND